MNLRKMIVTQLEEGIGEALNNQVSVLSYIALRRLYVDQIVPIRNCMERIEYV